MIMAFYYYEVQDPQNPSQTRREYFFDDEENQDDLIYQLPGGIYQYHKYKQVLDLIGNVMKERFLDNKPLKDASGNTFTPKLEESQYSDPELARIERANKPINIEMTPADTTEIKKQAHIKVEGKYQPEPVVFGKMMDYTLLPKIESVDEAGQGQYQQAEKELPHLSEIKRGMQVKILGQHLKIRPALKQEYGFYLVAAASGKKYDMTDFLQVNSNGVLLWLVPKDLPTGQYYLHTITGWYADATIVRSGVSALFDLI
ncbi:MAG TPA: hypothetical protein DCS93_14585 [Microscillaceae bacterium]|nr:hypothetical protein [Microscillaceae bacterium]